MAEILLVRHAKSYANSRETAVGNQLSPLDKKGILQAIGLRKRLREEYGIDPDTYDRPVLSSHFIRPRETAELTGFQTVHTSELIAEANMPKDLSRVSELIARHARERWAPEEVAVRSQLFIEQVRTGELDYEIYFSHGLFIASVLLQLSVELSPAQPFHHEFHDKRGFIPDLASITSVNV